MKGKPMSNARAQKRGWITIKPMYETVDGERVITSNKVARRTKRGKLVLI